MRAPTHRMLLAPLLIALLIPIGMFGQDATIGQEPLVDLLFDLKLGTDTSVVRAVFAGKPLEERNISHGNTTLTDHTVLWDKDTIRSEFSYSHGRLVSFGSHKRGMDSATADAMYSYVSGHVKARVGWPNRTNTDRTSEDAHGGTYNSMSWDLEGDLLGISIQLSYDGYMVSWGKQSLTASIVIERPSDDSMERKPSMPVGLLNDTTVTLYHEHIPDRTFRVPVHSPSGMPAGVLEFTYRSVSNAGPDVECRLIRDSDTVRITADEFHHHFIDRLLVYGETSTGFVVLQRTLDDTLVIHRSDVPRSMEFSSLIMYQTSQASWMYYDYERVPLRAAPDSASSVTLLLDEAMHRVRSFTGRTKDGWAEVIMYEMQDLGMSLFPCYTDDMLMGNWTGRIWTGWVRILNENGEVAHFRLVDAC